MKNLIAQIPIAPNGGFRGFGRLGLEGAGAEGSVIIFTNFVSAAVGLMTVIAIIWFVFVFFTGAIGIIGAGSDKGAVESSRKKITTGVTGIVVTLLALLLVRLIGYLIGIPSILNLNELLAPILNQP